MAYWVIINGCCSDFHAKTVWFDAKIWHFLTETGEMGVQHTLEYGCSLRALASGSDAPAMERFPRRNSCSTVLEMLLYCALLLSPSAVAVAVFALPSLHDLMY